MMDTENQSAAEAYERIVDACRQADSLDTLFAQAEQTLLELAPTAAAASQDFGLPWLQEQLTQLLRSSRQSAARLSVTLDRTRVQLMRKRIGAPQLVKALSELLERIEKFNLLSGHPAKSVMSRPINFNRDAAPGHSVYWGTIGPADAALADIVEVYRGRLATSTNWLHTVLSDFFEPEAMALLEDLSANCYWYVRVAREALQKAASSPSADPFPVTREHVNQTVRLFEFAYDNSRQVFGKPRVEWGLHVQMSLMLTGGLLFQKTADPRHYDIVINPILVAQIQRHQNNLEQQQAAAGPSSRPPHMRAGTTGGIG